MEESIVGQIINFRGLVYSPINEQGVVFLFGRVLEDLNLYIEEIRIKYPDCVARDDIAALTHEAKEVSGIKYVMDVDQGKVERILNS